MVWRESLVAVFVCAECSRLCELVEGLAPFGRAPLHRQSRCQHRGAGRPLRSGRCGGIRPEMPVDDSARTLAACLAAKQSTDGGLPLTIVPLTEER